MNNTLLLNQTVTAGGVEKWTISGTAKDGEGTGITSVTLTLSGDSEGTEVTSPGGTWSFSGLVDGTYTVTPSKSGYTFSPEDAEVVISGADDATSDFVGTAIWSISGDIVDGAAAAIEGVLVTLSGDADDTDTTDVNGHYEFTGLVDGSYTITPTLANYTFTPESDGVEISGADDTSDFVGESVIQSLPYLYNADAGVPSWGANLVKLTSTTVLTTAVGPVSLDGTTPSISSALKMRNNNDGERYIGFYELSILNSGKHISAASGLRIQMIEGNETGNNRRNPKLWVYENNGSNGLKNGIRFERDAANTPDIMNCWHYEDGSSTLLGTGYFSAFATPNENNWVTTRITIPANGTGDLLVQCIASGSTINQNETKTFAITRDWSSWKLDSLSFQGRCYAAAEGDHICFGHIWVGNLTDAWPT